MNGGPTYDVLVIGGGQSGLAVGYYLRRTGLKYLIVDNNELPGGSWQHYWQSLRLFSPAQWSSLPGTMMTGGPDSYPGLKQVVSYLNDYERKYKLPVERPVFVENVTRDQHSFFVQTTKGTLRARAVVSATGSFSAPVIPSLAGRDIFHGKVLHSSQYRRPEPFISQQVAVVGEGNSGAQILAELSRVAQTFWITAKQPRFLPEHVDGRYLFDAATQLYEAKKAGREVEPPSLGDIVMVPSVREAMNRGVFDGPYPIISHFTNLGVMLQNGQELLVDTVVFCTGFRANLQHLSTLVTDTTTGRITTDGTRSLTMPGLWLVGYGNWTGFASATLIGVGRSARATVEEIVAFLHGAS